MRLSGRGVDDLGGRRARRGTTRRDSRAATSRHRREQLADARGGTRRARRRGARGARCRRPRTSARPGTPRARPRSGRAATPTGTARVSAGVNEYGVALAPLLAHAACVAECLGARRSARGRARRASIASAVVVHELLRRRAADARVVAVPRVGAEPVGEPRDRVVVLPGLAVHDLRCCRARSSTPAPTACRRPRRARRRSHIVERLGRARRRRRRRGATCAARRR